MDLFEPRLVDTKGGVVTINGDNFGNDVNRVIVKMGDVLLQVHGGASFGHKQFLVTVPPGEGTAQDVNVTVDRQAIIIDRDDENVMKYYEPDVYTVLPAVIPTTGANVTLDGDYFGTEGDASTYLTKKSDGTDVYAVKLPYDVTIIQGAHDSMELMVAPGQGENILNVNVSKQFTQSSLSYFPPTIYDDETTYVYNATTNTTTEVTTKKVIIVPTNGMVNITLEGENFGIGSDYEISIVDNGDMKTRPVNNIALFNAVNPEFEFTEFSAEMVDYSHHSVTFTIPPGQNEKNEDLDLQITVAGQVSNSVKFNYAPPKIDKIAMCFSDALTDVYTGECTKVKDDNGDWLDELPELGSDCDPLSEDGCGLSTSGGYTLALLGENFGKTDAGIQVSKATDKASEARENNC